MLYDHSQAEADPSIRRISPMKLSNNDVIYLRDLGYTDTRSLKQIEKAAGQTVYTLGGGRISGKQAAEIWGRKAFLSGISKVPFTGAL